MKKLREKFINISLTFIVTLIVLCMMFNGAAFAVDDEHITIVPEGYKGIYTVEDLCSIEKDLSANYILMNDIDLSEAIAEGSSCDFDGRGWNPIGSKDIYAGSAFSGVFEGNGYRIEGMRMVVNSLPTRSGPYVFYGLFASVSGVVKNLTVIGKISSSISIPMGIYAGGITGYSTGKIENCTNKVEIRVSNIYKESSYSEVYTGGIVGCNYGIVTKCRNLSDIYAYVNKGYYSDGNIYYSAVASYAGGICGYGGNIVCCYNTGNITSKNGGYCAYSYASGISHCIELKNCYNTGAVTAKCNDYFSEYSYYYAAGIAYNGRTYNCYNTGKITGKNANYAISNNEATNCYYLSGSGSDSNGCSSLTELKMSFESMYYDWDFDTVWTIEGREDYLYPELREVAVILPNDMIFHKHSYSIERVEATHIDNGKIIYNCLCGDNYTETIEKIPHTFTEKIIDSAHLVSEATKESPAIYKYDCAGCNVMSEDFTFTYGEKLENSLGKLSKITATQTTNTIILNWSAVDCATGYRVYQYSHSKGKYVQIASIKGKTSYIKSKNLKAGSQYKFKIKPYVKLSDGTIIWGEASDAFATATKPTPPTTITATQTTSAIKLTWSASKGATGYRVYQYSPSKGKYVQIASLKGKTIYKKSKNLKAGLQYKFKIKPYVKLSDGTVIWGDASDAFTTATKPVPPTKITATTTSSAISLKWTESAGATGYRVYQYSPSKGKYMQIASVKGVTSYKKSKNLKANTTYKFKVKPYVKLADGTVIWGKASGEFAFKTKA